MVNTLDKYDITKNILFYSHGPVVRKYYVNDYYDKDEIGMTNYLQVLPSIALYGFMYMVQVDERKRIIDGNFKAYCAEELGIKVPVMISKREEGMRFRLIWIVRKLLGKKYFWKFKKRNPEFDMRFRQVNSYCGFQENILDKVEEFDCEDQLKILYLWDVCGVGSDLAEYIRVNNIGNAYVIHRKKYDRNYHVRRYNYNYVLDCSSLRFVLNVIKHLVFFKPRIVHINYWVKGIIFVKLFSRAKIVMQFHGSDLRGKKLPFFVKRFCDRIIVTTKDLVRKDVDLLGVPIV